MKFLLVFAIGAIAPSIKQDEDPLKDIGYIIRSVEANFRANVIQRKTFIIQSAIDQVDPNIILENYTMKYPEFPNSYLSMEQVILYIESLRDYKSIPKVLYDALKNANFNQVPLSDKELDTAMKIWNRVHHGGSSILVRSWVELVVIGQRVVDGNADPIVPDIGQYKKMLDKLIQSLKA